MKFSIRKSTSSFNSKRSDDTTHAATTPACIPTILRTRQGASTRQRPARRLAILLAGLVVSGSTALHGGAFAQTASAPDVSIAATIDPATSKGAMPSVMRPSAMMSWADSASITNFLAMPGKIGAVRLSLESSLTDSASLADYKSRVQAQLATMKTVLARNADVVVTFARMPRWLASKTDEGLVSEYGFTLREGSPPKDYAAFQSLAKDTVTLINGALGSKVRYEFWNEPDSPSFWNGSALELFRAYAAFVRGARAADQVAKVGGLAVGNWSGPKEGETDTRPLLQRFFQYAAAPDGGARLPLDFVSWHYFSSSPLDGWGGTQSIKSWLSAYGYSTATPQYVTEWNRWADSSTWMDAPRDSHLGSAYVLMAMQGMAFNNVTGATIAALQDFNSAPSGQAFLGDFGLITQGTNVKKASYNAMAMLSMMPDTRIAATLPASADGQGVAMVAAKTGTKTAVLLHRYAADWYTGFMLTLQRYGITSFSQLGLSTQQLIAYLGGSFTLPSTLTATQTQVLTAAKAAAVTASSKAASGVKVALNLPVTSTTTYQMYVIDSTRSNAGQTYRDKRAAGASYTDAMTAAKAAQSLKLVSQGTGKPASVRLGQYDAVLIVFNS